VLAALVAAGVGCSGSESAVEGVVTLDGQPVDKAVVTFNPAEGGRPSAGQTGSDGKFKLSEKLKPGTYKVTVSKRNVADAGGPIDPSDASKKADMLKMMTGSGKGKVAEPSKSGPPAPKSLLPEKYDSTEKTPFEIKIPSSGSIKLEMQSSK
jgi:hypothetical protein